METIFGFVSVQPIGPAGVFDGVRLDAPTDFQHRLVRTRDSDTPRADALAASEEFLRSEAAIRDANDVTHGRDLLDAAVTLGGNVQTRVDDVIVFLESHLGELPPFVATGSFVRDASRVRDTLVAAYLTGASIEFLQSLARGVALVELAASGGLTDRRCDAVLRGPIEMPALVEALRAAPGKPPTHEDPAAKAEALGKEIENLRNRSAELERGLAEIQLVQSDELSVSSRDQSQPLTELLIQRSAPATRPGTPRPAVDFQGAFGSTLVSRASERQNVMISGPALESMPVSAVRAIRSLNLDPSVTPIREIQSTMSGEVLDVRSQILNKVSDLFKLGVAARAVAVRLRLQPVDDPIQEDGPWSPAVPQLPTTHGSAKPVGIADLLLVKSQILRYERGEVAKVESVLPGEKLILTERSTQTEEVTVVEESEQTTFESESKSIAEDSGRSTTRAVAPGYGPVNEGRETSQFAQSVTRQAASNAASRARTQTTRRSVKEHEEKTERILDNTAGPDARYAIYQWLDKVHQVQVFNYGRRLLYDLIVPEPAALVAKVMAQRKSGAVPLIKPALFRLEPTELNEDNYAYYVSGHGATGIEAPPALNVVVSEAFADRSANPFSPDANLASVFKGEARVTRIPKGYAAKKLRVTMMSDGWDVSRIAVFAGTQIFPMSWGVREAILRGETETIPVGIKVDGEGPAVTTFAAGIEILCERTSDLFAAWQLKTHAAILEANRRRFKEYEDRLASREASARLMLQTLDAQRKKALMATEIKRCALSVLTGQDFSGFNAISTDGFSFPHPSLFAVDQLSAYIRFFEQAIEWEHVGHVFFPYFWGRKKTWIDRVVTDEPDPEFVAFLQAGAARVVLPVRLGYEAALERFMNTGLTPTNDELINMGSPLWVSLIDQMRRLSASPGSEVAVGDPWEVRVPAALLRARPDGSMPLWKAQGAVWVDGPDPGF